MKERLKIFTSNRNNKSVGGFPLKSEPNIQKDAPKKLVINPNLYGKDGRIRIMSSIDRENPNKQKKENVNNVNNSNNVNIKTKNKESNKIKNDNKKVKTNNKTNENDLQEYLYGTNKEEDKTTNSGKKNKNKKISQIPKPVTMKKINEKPKKEQKPKKKEKQKKEENPKKEEKQKMEEKTEKLKKEIIDNDQLLNNISRQKTEQPSSNLLNVLESLQNPKSQYEQEQELKEKQSVPAPKPKKMSLGEKIRRNFINFLSPGRKTPDNSVNIKVNEEAKEKKEVVEEKKEQKVEEKTKPTNDKKIKNQNRNRSTDVRKLKNDNLKRQYNISTGLNDSEENPLDEFRKKQNDYYKKEYVNIEPIDNATYLKKLRVTRNPIERETFCEGFFIASFPYTKAQVIENSQSFPSPCGHKQCSTFPAMKPEIIMRYPLVDTKNLELNNLAATICFPTGIKVCYSEEPPTHMIDDFLTSITNQKGERYYMMTYHFYQKINNNEYTTNYEMHPLKNHLMKFGDSYLTLSDEGFTEKIIKKVQETLELCQELGFRDYVYVPFCLSIISRYPYAYEMTRCLQSILNVMSEEDIINYSKMNFKINDLIMYLINTVPVPIEKNTRVKFYIPFFDKGISIKCPKLDEINVVNINYIRLIELFSIDNFLLIIRLLLFEKKILFIDDDYTRLSEVTDAFISLLYPFKWVHTYIPIMSDQMLKYLETFLPFLNGIHSSLMTSVAQFFNQSEMDDEDEIFLIYNKEGKIDLSSSLKKKKKKLAKYIQTNIPPLPVAIEKKLKNKLNEIKDSYNNNMKAPVKRYTRVTGPIDVTQFDKDMRDALINMFVDMFRDYPKYICLLDNDVVFNKNSFMKTIEKQDTKFYDELMDTQLFQQFTQSIFTHECDYFNTIISEDPEEKNDLSGIPLNVRNEKVYVIPPCYLGTNEKDNQKIERFVSQYYPSNLESNFISKDEYKDVNGIILPSHRIIPCVTEIQNEDYNDDNCLIYLLPNQIRVSMKRSLLRETSEQLLKTIKPQNLNTSGIQGIQGMGLRKTLTSASFADELNEIEKEEIREIIKDYMRKIFKSEKIEYEDPKIKTELLNLLKKSFGREFFISLLSSNLKNIVTLQLNSFSFLKFLIYNVLVESLQIAENDKLLEEVYLLIKSTMHFGIDHKGKTKTLFHDMKDKIRDFPKINQKNFWNIWFEKEIDILKDKGDATKQIVILNICSKMVELEISKIIIKDILDDLNKNAFEDNSEMGNQTQKMYMRKITDTKYGNAKNKK